MMHQQISKKILFYLFLFILLGTVNNFKFSKIYKFKINEIKVYGLNNAQNLKILNQLDFLKFDNLLFLDKIVIDEIINSYNFVEKYFVFKRYPQTLEIKILKAKNIANVVKDNNFFFIGSNGKLIESNKPDKNIPFVFGNFDNKNFLAFKKEIEMSKLEYNQIEKIFYFNSNRWDIKMKNGVLIKLPNLNIIQGLDLASKFISEKKFLEISTIDLRIKNQVIVNNE